MLFGVWLHPGLLRPINPIHNITGASSTTTTPQFRVSPSTTAQYHRCTINDSHKIFWSHHKANRELRHNESAMNICLWHIVNQVGWASKTIHKITINDSHSISWFHFHKINAQCKGYPMDNIHIVRQEAVECSLKGNHWYLWKCIWYLCWSILERKRASWVFWCSPDAIIW